MAYYESLEPVTMIAQGTIGQYKVVMVDVANDRGVLPCTDVDNVGIMGFAQLDGVAGDAITIGIEGVTKAVAGATVARGASVASNATGFVITATTNSRRVGIALASGSVNDIIPVLITVGAELA